jgi:hypothetical protein
MLTVERDSQLRHGRCESWAFLVVWSRATMAWDRCSFLVIAVNSAGKGTFRLSYILKRGESMFDPVYTSLPMYFRHKYRSKT